MAPVSLVYTYVFLVKFLASVGYERTADRPIVQQHRWRLREKYTRILVEIVASGAILRCSLPSTFDMLWPRSIVAKCIHRNVLKKKLPSAWLGSRTFRHTKAPYLPAVAALPATPETYLALRTSPLELHTLPAVSIEALIYEAGQAGLSGLIGTVISDVMDYRAADAGSDRQQRLLLALLTMSSICQKRVPMAPEMVVNLAAQYIQVAGVTNLSPSITAHIMRHCFAMPRKDGVQRHLIHTLFYHLVHTAEYPLLEEGLQVIEYMLRYEWIDPSITMDFVIKTAEVDGDRLGKHTLEQARADGFAWQRWAQDAGGFVAVSELRHGKGDEVRDYAFRISLWSLACRAWIRLNRSTRFRESFARLQKEYTAATKAVTMGSTLQAPPNVSVLRALLQAHLMNLAGTRRANALRAALVTLKQVPKVLVAQLSPRVIQSLCHTALDLDNVATAASLFQWYIVCVWHTNDDKRRMIRILRDMHPATLVPMLSYMAESVDRSAAAQWADWLVGPKSDPYMDTFPEAFRARWLMCLCMLDLLDQARYLYRRWTGSSGTPLEPEVRAAYQNRHTSKDRTSTTTYSRIHRAFGLDVLHGSVEASHHASENIIHGTAPCMLALVRKFGQGTQWQKAPDTNFARAVRDDFLTHVYGSHMPPSHYQLTALLQACFLLGDYQVAMHVLRTMESCRYNLDAKDMAVLLGGMVNVNPSAAVVILKDLSAPLSQNPHLYAVVLSRCVSSNQFELADQVYDMACQQYLGSQVARLAPGTLLACSRDYPTTLVNRAITLMRDGWKPKQKLLNWVIRTVVRGMNLRDARLSVSPHGISHDYDVASGVRLFVYTASKHGCTDIPTARLILYHIFLLTTRPSSPLTSTEWQSQWSAKVDAVLCALFSTMHTGAQHLSMSVSETLQRKLPIPLSLIQEALRAYMSLQDHTGVQELLAWLHIHGLSVSMLLKTPYKKDLCGLSQVPVDTTRRQKPWWSLMETSSTTA